MAKKDPDAAGMDTTTSLKCTRPGDSPQHPSQSKKTKKKGGCVCPICLEVILEATKGKKGHDAIYCKGLCSSWLHRHCAGLSKAAFANLEKSPDPYYCPHCLLKKHTDTISELKATVASLTEAIEALESSVKKSVPKSVPPSIPHESLSAATQPIPVHPAPRVNPTKDYEDKKNNIVMYGIKESSPKTSVRSP